ncbi:hypothetical protein [Solidesulfovibrio alcoholivorans]|uniref:hypothetical protein n=1 Tax=Solidesulfovibrio alcoholivorans TaxID=81406 RepID=UPI003CCB8317
MDKNRRFLFELSYRVGDTELGRAAQAHLHMVRQGMRFDQFQPELLAQLFGDEHNMVPAIFLYFQHSRIDRNSSDHTARGGGLTVGIN